MDPLSLIAMASTTFKGIQTLVDKGAEIEHVAQKLGQWYSFASDIKEAEKEAENPGVFKKLYPFVPGHGVCHEFSFFRTSLRGVKRRSNPLDANSSRGIAT